MQLPKDATAIAAKFTELTDERKNAVIKHLAEVSDNAGQATVNQIVKNGGPEGRFVARLFDLPEPAREDAPNNKAATVTAAGKK